MSLNIKEAACAYRLRAAHDALEAINGKWKIPIVLALSFGSRRFGELHREIGHISPKMLSKELKDLEMSQLIKRTVFDSTPVVIEYSLTEVGQSLKPLMNSLVEWGTYYRKEVMSVKQAK